MMKWLVTSALSQRVLVIAIALVLVLLGIRATRDVPLDVFPEFAPPMVEVQTEAPGLSTEEVENLVTIPLEAAVNGVPGLTTLRSKSVLGLSSVVLIFAERSDVIRARQLVQERVAAIGPRLPANVGTPVMLPPLSATSRAMKIGISSRTMDQMAMSDVVRWTVRPRLMAVPGVANVAVWGQRDRQLQVLVDPARLATRGVTLAEVQRAAGDAAISTGGGFVDTPNQRLAVRHLSPIETPEHLARTVIKLMNGAPIRIGDVATVTEGHAAPIGDAIINDKPGLLLIVEKHQGGNTLDVTKGVETALAELKPALGGLEVDSTIFRPATFIERSLSNLSQAMLIGCLLVALVLIVFTRDWRSAAISLVAIPLSLLGASLMLSWMGASINTMVIAGLVIALGEIVDDAIIDVENIRRRLRINREAGSPRSAFEVVLGASLEVRTAVVFASLIVMLVFLPIFFLEGLSGTFFRPLATAYVLAIGTSLLVALTITPALCLMLLTGEREARPEPDAVRWLKSKYRNYLPRVVEKPRLAAAVVAGGLLAAAVGYMTFEDQFLPDFRETDFLMHFVEKPGTSIEAMDRITILASKELRAIPGVRNFGSHIGRAEAGDEVYGPNFTELWISLDETADYDSSLAKIKEAVEGYPGLYRDVLTYLRERIKEVLTGAGATVVVRIYGPDMAELRSMADKIKTSISGVPGVSDLKVEQQSLIPQIQVEPRPEALATYGLTTGEVRRATATMIKGTKVGEVYRDQRSYDVAVWGTPAVRSDLHALRDLLIPTPAGGQVRLGDVADVRIMPAANEIKRENGSRRIDVTMNIASSGDLGSVARSVEDKVTALPFRQGYYPEFLGEYAALQQSQRQLLFMSALCLAGILLLIWLEFRSLRLTALIAASLPFALLGGVIAVLLSGGTMSLGALVGFVTVLGISARNGIMLVSHYRHLERVEGETFGTAMILRGAEERLVPILMTASCAALALLPLVVRGDVPGHEIEHPMALVILGGLISSTALNLLLMPTLYARFARPPARRCSSKGRAGMRRLFTLAILLSGGCAAVPVAPETVVPSDAVGAFVGARGNAVTQAPVPADWWRLFDDPVLDAHVQRALSANSDLRVALANLEVARAAVRQANAARSIRAGAESGRGSTSAIDQPSTTMVSTSDYDLGATVAYEVDLFGRLRSAVLAARADADASAAAVDAARVTVAAETVSAYVDLCGAIAGSRIAEQTATAQRRSAGLIARQLHHGEVSPLELSQAQAEVRRVEADVPQFEADRRRALFRLATLQGRAPSEADSLPIGCKETPKVAAPVPVGDGATLIARRPDIREAERRIAAATARIGVATADLYPRISIGGSGGLIGGGFDAFVTPLISWAFLDRNAARAKIAAARGTEKSALASWDAIVLRALREVESALADYAAERTRREALIAALGESEKALTRARSRFRLGADSYLLVLVAERSRNEAASRLASAELRIAQSQVALFRALGGGWELHPRSVPDES